MVDWGSKEEILGEKDDGYREMGNRGREEQKVNSATEKSQLENIQYKLSQRNEIYSKARTKKIIELEMPGMRKEIPKGGLINVTGVLRCR